ncbi:MAG: DUF2442 domain-containing protein [Bacteroidota bacterium]
MSTSTNKPVKALDVRIEEELFFAILEDGRHIGVPYTWFWRLDQATDSERKNWRFIGGGTGIHWEDIDEDISVAGMLNGQPQNPARLPKATAPV